MRKLATPALTASLLLAGAGTALADDAKPAAPSLSDVLGASGLTATGWVDGTYSYVTQSSTDSNTFGLNQAALNVAYLPTSGFGASATVIAGTEAFDGGYAPGYSGGVGASNTFNVLEGYVQYAGGPVTLKVGKYTTLAGAEVAAPTGNTNVTRSLLFWYSEPVNHTGVRLAYTAGMATIYGGINEGWNVTSSVTKDKTFEAGVALAPSKAVAVGFYGYYGDVIVDPATGLKGKKMLVDFTGTFTVSDKFTIVASADYDTVENGAGVGSTAKWYGAALYGNYAISDEWRSSLRLEYLDDQDGFTTGAVQKLKEGTLTFGYAPAKNFEFRIEGRYDQSDATGSEDLTQAWLQAVYKF